MSEPTGVEQSGFYEEPEVVEHLPPTLPVENPQSTEELTNYFGEILKEADAGREGKKGSFFGTWTKIRNFHDDNGILRAQVQQLTFMMQTQMHEWQKYRNKIAGELGDLNSTSDTETAYQEKINAILDVDKKYQSLVIETEKSITRLHKEIRQTEYQARDMYHASVIAEFMMGFQAILMTKLQGTPQKDAIIREFKKMSKLLQSQGDD